METKKNEETEEQNGTPGVMNVLHETLFLHVI